MAPLNGLLRTKDIQDVLDQNVHAGPGEHHHARLSRRLTRRT
jgi:hypothetical protein